MQMIVAAQVMVIRGHQGQTSVLLLNHYLMGKEESRWQVPVPWHPVAQVPYTSIYKLIKKMGIKGAIPEVPIL